VCQVSAISVVLILQIYQLIEGFFEGRVIRTTQPTSTTLIPS
jgi:hypothetical protein